jgi:hypothetical protein
MQNAFEISADAIATIQKGVVKCHIGLAIAIYTVLCKLSQKTETDTGTVKIKTRELANHLGTSPVTSGKVIKQLVALNLITSTRKFQQANEYTIVKSSSISSITPLQSQNLDKNKVLSMANAYEQLHGNTPVAAFMKARSDERLNQERIAERLIEPASPQLDPLTEFLLAKAEAEAEAEEALACPAGCVASERSEALAPERSEALAPERSEALAPERSEEEAEAAPERSEEAEEATPTRTPSRTPAIPVVLTMIVAEPSSKPTLPTTPEHPAAPQSSSAATHPDRQLRRTAHLCSSVAPLTQNGSMPSSDGFKYADWFKTLLPQGFSFNETQRTNAARTFDTLAQTRDKRQICTVTKWARNNPFWAAQFTHPTRLTELDKKGVPYYEVFLNAHDAAKKPKSDTTSEIMRTVNWILDNKYPLSPAAVDILITTGCDHQNLPICAAEGLKPYAKYII